MQIDMRVMELLASKICHDLVSPVSAINNGVELIEDIGASVTEEAMKLIGDSGITAARRLRLFRMAYGRAGSEEALAMRDVKQVAEQYLSTTKVSLIWANDVPAAELADRRGFLKTLLNVIIMAEESLAYGGVVTLRAAPEGCRVEIVGRNASLSLPVQEALGGDVPFDVLTPRSIQSYVTGRFAEHFGLSLLHDHSVPDRLDLTLALQAKAQKSEEVEPDALSGSESPVMLVNVS